jgi:hypothetical protein
METLLLTAFTLSFLGFIISSLIMFKLLKTKKI